MKAGDVWMNHVAEEDLAAVEGARTEAHGGDNGLEVRLVWEDLVFERRGGKAGDEGNHSVLQRGAGA